MYICFKQETISEAEGHVHTDTSTRLHTMHDAYISHACKLTNTRAQNTPIHPYIHTHA